MKARDFNNVYPSLLCTLELPQDICLGMMKCTLCGNREAVIENGRCILEYTCTNILIKGKKQKLQIQGKRLLIPEYTREYIRVYGEIISIQFV